MKEKYLINTRIIDPKSQMDEIGGLIIDVNGKIKAVGKKVTNGNLPTEAEKIDLKKQILMPGIVDMRVFVGEPGYEYKENFTFFFSSFDHGYSFFRRYLRNMVFTLIFLKKR